MVRPVYITLGVIFGLCGALLLVMHRPWHVIVGGLAIGVGMMAAGLLLGYIWERMTRRRDAISKPKSVGTAQFSAAMICVSIATLRPHTTLAMCFIAACCLFTFASLGRFLVGSMHYQSRQRNQGLSR